jgi:hypothetical protein
VTHPYYVRGCLLIEPLANPAFIEAGLAREFLAGEGTGTIQRTQETHAVAKMDHARNQRSREVAEDLLREFLRFHDIYLMILVRHCEPSQHTKILAAALCDITLDKSQQTKSLPERKKRRIVGDDYLSLALLL